MSQLTADRAHRLHQIDEDEQRFYRRGKPLTIFMAILFVIVVVAVAFNFGSIIALVRK